MRYRDAGARHRRRSAPTAGRPSRTPPRDCRPWRWRLDVFRRSIVTIVAEAADREGDLGDWDQIRMLYSRATTGSAGPWVRRMRVPRGFTVGAVASSRAPVPCRASSIIPGSCQALRRSHDPLGGVCSRLLAGAFSAARPDSRVTKKVKVRIAAVGNRCACLRYASQRRAAQRERDAGAARSCFHSPASSQRRQRSPRAARHRRPPY